jgi:hypothetical protein
MQMQLSFVSQNWALTGAGVEGAGHFECFEGGLWCQAVNFSQFLDS